MAVFPQKLMRETGGEMPQNLFRLIPAGDARGKGEGKRYRPFSSESDSGEKDLGEPAAEVSRREQKRDQCLCR